MSVFWKVTNSLLSAVTPGATAGISGKLQSTFYEMCRIYCDRYENINYNPHENGEYWLLSRLSHSDISIIFDVGANRGEWTVAALRRFPNATVHAFEIVPETFAALRTATENIASVHPNSFGLSESSGEIEVHVSRHSSELSSMLPVDGLYDNAGIAHDWKSVKCQVAKGDDYCSSKGIDHIDLLKIDVEGAEYRVLQGLKATLLSAKISIIQFEYGAASLLLDHRTAADFWNLLTGYGFSVGKLMPAAVEFGPYSPRLEAKWANLVAVHQSRSAVLNALKGRPCNENPS